jgi:hypothetical protein
MADTNIYVILDGSGSMGDVKHDVVKGINTFIKEQKQDAQIQGDDVLFSLTTFDNKVMEVYVNEDLQLVSDVALKDTYLGGGTALLDSIGRTLTAADGSFAPRNILVIYTDGGENSSREFTKEQVSKLLEDFEQNRNGQVIYLGAEFADFVNDTAGYGTVAMAAAGASSLNTSKQHVSSTFSNLSRGVSYYRGASPEEVNVVNQTKGGLVAHTTAAGTLDWNKDKTDEKETRS